MRFVLLVRPTTQIRLWCNYLTVARIRVMQTNVFCFRFIKPEYIIKEIRQKHVIYLGKLGSPTTAAAATESRARTFDKARHTVTAHMAQVSAPQAFCRKVW